VGWVRALSIRVHGSLVIGLVQLNEYKLQLAVYIPYLLLDPHAGT
jgi:hypothetical protein